MWAGGRVSFNAPLPLGGKVKKRSAVKAVAHKSGRRGDLVFVTVLHEIFHENRIAVSEEHDIVYRNPGEEKSGTSLLTGGTASTTRVVDVTSTTLFRYSALTFNGHRIHYDVDYCRDVEGYSNLVIHGPLSATLLAAFAEETAGKKLKSFSYRGVRPAILGTPLSLNATDDSKVVAVWTSLPDGAISMQAEAILC
jgi:3-methylfumaryl-CoA hydratase